MGRTYTTTPGRLAQGGFYSRLAGSAYLRGGYAPNDPVTVKTRNKGFNPFQPFEQIWEEVEGVGRSVGREADRIVGDVGRQIDRSTQDVADILTLGIHPAMKKQERLAADAQAQQAAQNRELAQYMANINRERANYSLINSIMQARRAVAMRSHRSQGILTSPLGAPIDQNKKMLLGQ